MCKHLMSKAQKLKGKKKKVAHRDRKIILLGRRCDTHRRPRQNSNKSKELKFYVIIMRGTSKEFFLGFLLNLHTFQSLKLLINHNQINFLYEFQIGKSLSKPLLLLSREIFGFFSIIFNT